MGEPPDINCFNTVIAICGELGKVDFAFQLFDYMITLQLPPNSHTFAHLVDLCVRAGDLRRAMQVLYEMRSAGWSPNAATIDGVLLAGARSNEPLRTLVQLIEQQRMEGRPLQPLTAVELIKSLAAAGRHADAVELFTTLGLSSANPGETAAVEALNALQAMGNDGSMNEALRRLVQLFHQMAERVKGSVPPPSAAPAASANLSAAATTWAPVGAPGNAEQHAGAIGGGDRGMEGHGNQMDQSAMNHEMFIGAALSALNGAHDTDEHSGTNEPRRSPEIS